MTAVIGLWDGHDASVALIADGALRFALAEERPGRRKRTSGFPTLALRRCLDWAADHGVAITDVALAGRHGRAPQRLLDRRYRNDDPHRAPLALDSRAAMAWESIAASSPGRTLEALPGWRAVGRKVACAAGRRLPLTAVDHHDAHAFAALLLAPRERATVVSWDAYGDGRSATVRGASRPDVARGVPAPGGLALLYGAVTVALGFCEGDEGKLTGRAALGDADRHEARFRALFDYRDGVPTLRRPLREATVAELLRGASTEDAAAGLQACTERLATGWIRRVVRARGGARPLLLAGGLFANVGLVRALARLPGVEALSVFPAMGDAGLSAGAAHALWRARTGALAAPLDDVFLGCEVAAGDVERAVAGSGLAVCRVDDPAAAAAAHLRAGRVVCRFGGRDEFGPRALGHRSILFAADSPRLGERVNRALGRDGAMPFGPLLPAGELDALLDDGPGIRPDLRFMTAAVDASARLREAAPGAVHVDGTTRPQVVDRSTTPGLAAVLAAYRRLGGAPALINTSLNLHGEPIVHTPADAVDTFRRAGLDVLYLGDRELRRPGLR